MIPSSAAPAVFDGRIFGISDALTATSSNGGRKIPSVATIAPVVPWEQVAEKRSGSKQAHARHPHHHRSRDEARASKPTGPASYAVAFRCAAPARSKWVRGIRLLAPSDRETRLPWAIRGRATTSRSSDAMWAAGPPKAAVPSFRKSLAISHNVVGWSVIASGPHRGPRTVAGTSGLHLACSAVGSPVRRTLCGARLGLRRFCQKVLLPFAHPTVESPKQDRR